MLIYFIGVAISALLTIALGVVFYLSDEEITIGNVFCGIVIAFTSWVGVIAYFAIVIAFLVELLIHQEFWSRTLFKRFKD